MDLTQKNKHVVGFEAVNEDEWLCRLEGRVCYTQFFFIRDVGFF